MKRQAYTQSVFASLSLNERHTQVCAHARQDLASEASALAADI